MKTLLLIPVLFIFCTHALAQNAYYDAIDLKKYVDDDGLFKTDTASTRKIAEILKPYIPSSRPNALPKAVLVIIGDDHNFADSYNPFIGPKINVNGLESSSTNIAVTPKSSSVQELISSVGGTDVTKYADALAQFMIERAQAELTVAFFDRFKKFTEEHTEIKTLFPKTCQRMDDLLTIQYRQMLNVLREAFLEDLNELPDHLIDVVEDYAKENDYVGIELAVNTLHQVQKLKYLSPSEFISELPEITKNVKDSSPQWYKNLNSSLELVAIFSNSLQDVSATRNWVQHDSIQKNLIENRTTRTIYMGLVYQQILNDSISFNGTLIADSIRNKSEEMNWLNDQFTDIIDLFDDIEDAAQQLKDLMKKGESPSNAQVQSYISTTLQVLDLVNDFYEHYSDGTNSVEEYLSIIEKANDIYKYVYEKQYGSAVLETAALLQQVYPKIKESRIKSINLLSDSIAENHFAAGKFEINSISASKINKDVYLNELVKDFNRIVADSDESSKKLNRQFKDFLSDKLSALEKENPWAEGFINFGVFMANLVEAETAEDAKAVIEAAALPVGSSTLRKRSSFTINLTSYLGAGFDIENNFNTTVTAPIGLDFATGFGKGGSLSLNLSLLDIGAIVDYRLANDSSSIESTITLGNIFSPGAQIVYGFPYQIPLAIGIGAQYGPGLTGISTDGIQVNNEPQWRAKAFIAVDMPLFNFYNKQKAKL